MNSISRKYVSFMKPQALYSGIHISPHLEMIAGIKNTGFKYRALEICVRAKLGATTGLEGNDVSKNTKWLFGEADKLALIAHHTLSGRLQSN